MTRVDFARSLIQQNREFYDYRRNGVPVEWRDASGETQYARARVVDVHGAGELAEDLARPIIYHDRAATCWYPHLKGLKLHHNGTYSNWRFEDVWLDR